MEAFLDQNVLVLNRLWQAVNVCSVRRALSLLYQGHAQVVNPTSDSFQVHDFSRWHSESQVYTGSDVVRGVTFRLRIPKIILLLVFDRLPKKEVKFTRQNVFERDGYRCQYCRKKFDRKDLNLDHVIPREKGGETSWENIVTSCIRCNSKKANRTPRQANMRLMKTPARPKWRPLLQVQVGRQPAQEWRHFLDIAYWNVELSGDT